MARASASSWVLFGLAVAAAGCGTPEMRYGHTARYSPYHRGYVVTRADLTHAPPSSMAVLVLRDPLTDDKIRCREQLLPWLGGQGRATDATVRVENDVERSAFVLLPLSIVASAGLMVGVVAIAPGLIAAPSETAYYEKGVAAFQAGRYDDASNALETALMMAPLAAGFRGRAYVLYYLGFAYEQERRDDLARRTLAAFVERAGVANERAYQDAEERLVRLGGALPSKCESTEPVSFVWGG
jgi:tetratricopeptide (TPR) repeat protein